MTATELDTDKCQNWDELPTEMQNNIETIALTILQNLATNQIDEVWESTHPLIQAVSTKQIFARGMQDIQLRLNNVNQTVLDDVRLITLTVDEALKASNLICGSTNIDDSKYLQVKISAAVEKVVIVMVYIPNQAIGRTVSLKLADYEDQLKILGIEIADTHYSNKDATYYADLGQQWLSEDKVVSAYLAYALANDLSYLGTFLQNGQNIRLSEAFVALTKNQTMHPQLTTWLIGDTTYTIYHLGLIATLNDIAPHIKYISHTDLTEETTPREAELLLNYLEQNHPELSTIFDEILFEAYQEAPTDPNKNYPYYRVPLKLK